MTILSSANGSGVQFVKRPSDERGHADTGWLKTFHTFNFNMYYDPRFDQFGAIRVLNEDRLSPMHGVPTIKNHQGYDVLNYIIDGELEHRDGQGSVEILQRGDVLMTSCGTGAGVSHTERPLAPVHLLQVWLTPTPITDQPRPRFFTRSFTDAEKMDRLCPIVSPIGSQGVYVDQRNGPGIQAGPIPAQCSVYIYTSLLRPMRKLVHRLHTSPLQPSSPATPPSPNSSSSQNGRRRRRAYIQVLQTSGYNYKVAIGNCVRVNGAILLNEGDGAFCVGDFGETIELENIGQDVAEIVLFDVE